MTDSAPAANLLPAILNVLERIEQKLDRQEQRLNAIDDGPRTPQSSATTNPSGEVDLADLTEVNEQDEDPQSTWQSQGPEKLEVPYSDLGFSCHEPIDNDSFRRVLETHIGDCWKLPDDRRLPLNFSNRSIDWTNAAWNPRSTSSATQQAATVKNLERLRRFDADLRAQPGNDFMIIDYNARGNCRLYRVGEKAAGSELKVSLGEPSHHQWSRLILYQGMTTGESIKPRSEAPGYPNAEPIPYFSRSGTSPGLWTHLSAHLELKRRATTTNPYLNPTEGFHTTFYEIRKKGVGHNVKELWKQGPLYEHPLGWCFRKSAYTLYSPPQLEATEPFVAPESRSLVPHWTLLLLAPDHFFNENNLSFPLRSQTPQKVETLSHSFGRLHSLGAEMNLIAQGLAKISERWAEFQSFFDFSLDGGDSLMQPSEHDNLLFDDGAFSRSRRYFWAIDCLSEFDSSISDNIAQWELYKTARIQPLLAIDGLPALDYRQYRNAEKHCRILHVQRDYFRQKFASTKALRDALFNASAVIESRAATRLGENVKLLTFVNIFFLPLSFCTSLWSINDRFSTTSFIITIILVAFLTYSTMFNVNNLVHLCGSIYDARKKGIVGAMKTDTDERWRQRGRRFEVFRPKHDHPEPSEWYITLYSLLRPATLLGIGPTDGDTLYTGTGSRQSSFGLAGMSNLLRWRRPKPEEPEVPDEGWVL